MKRMIATLGFAAVITSFYALEIFLKKIPKDKK